MTTRPVQAGGYHGEHKPFIASRSAAQRIAILNRTLRVTGIWGMLWFEQYSRVNG